MNNNLRAYALLALAVLSLVGIVAWQLAFDSVSLYVITAAVLILSMLPMFIEYEKKGSTSAEVTLTASMIALAVASRASFYLVPQVKPIAAVVVVAAVCLGAERGYIVGAFAAFVSNFLFGQGYWTPFQMVALGLVGLLSGLIFKAVKVNRYSLSLVGFVLSSALYGLITDISTILVYYGNKPTLGGIIATYAAGVPFSLVFGVSTAVFLFLFGEAFIKKVNRVTEKYNLI